MRFGSVPALCSIAAFAALALIVGIGIWRLAQLLPLWFTAAAVPVAGLPGLSVGLRGVFRP